MYIYTEKKDVTIDEIVRVNQTVKMIEFVLIVTILRDVAKATQLIFLFPNRKYKCMNDNNHSLKSSRVEKSTYFTETDRKKKEKHEK